MKHACSTGCPSAGTRSVEIQSPRRKREIDGHVGAQVKQEAGSWNTGSTRCPNTFHGVEAVVIGLGGWARHWPVSGKAVKALVPRDGRDGLGSFKFIAANPTHLSCSVNERTNYHRTSALLGAQVRLLG